MKKKLIFISLLMLLFSFSLAYGAINDAEVYYSFDDDDLTGSNPDDLSGNGNDGTNNGATTGVSGYWLEAFDYDGTNDYVDSGYTFTSVDDYTIGFKFQTTTTGTERIAGYLGTDRVVFLINSPTAGDLRVKVGRGGTNANLDSTTITHNDGNWHNVLLVSDRSGNTVLYVDNISQGTTATPNDAMTDTYSIPIGARNNAGTIDSYFDGVVDEFGLWEKAFSASEITEWEEATENPYFTPGPPTSANFTLSGSNTYNDLNLSNVNVSIELDNGTNYFYQNSTGNFIEADILANYTGLANITANSTTYISQTFQNVNISEHYAFKLYQSELNFSISELYTGDIIELYNATLDNGTFIEVTDGYFTVFAPTSEIEIEIEPAGYYAQNVTYTATGGEIGSYTFTDFYNATIQFQVKQFQDNNISVNAFDVDFNPNGTSINYATSNGSLQIPTILNDNYTFTFSSPGYFDQDYNFTINQTFQNETVNLSLFGGVLFSFYDSDTLDLVTSEIFLTVENATYSQEYQFTGGTQTVTDLNANQEFNFYYYSAGYATNTYYLTYENQTSIDLYLINGTDNITYTLKSEGDEPIQDAEITIEKFIEGSWTQIASQLTDVTGISVFALERGISHRITMSKEGYETKVDINRFSETDFTVVLNSIGDVDFDLGYQYLKIDLNPKNTSLTPSNQEFSLNFTSDVANIEYVILELFYNGTLLNSDNSTSNTGALLSFTEDLTAYNDTLVMIKYTYKILNTSGATSLTKVYKVIDTTYYEGTLLELKDRLESSLTIGEKIGLYTIVFFVTLIFVSIFVTGMPAVITALAISTLAGWIFGINLLLLSFVITALVLYTIAFQGEHL